MPEYRIYRVARSGCFIDGHLSLTATDDDEALRAALVQQLKSVWAFELWTGNRLVTLTPVNPDLQEASLECHASIVRVPLSRGGMHVGVVDMAAAASTEA